MILHDLEQNLNASNLSSSINIELMGDDASLAVAAN